MKTDNLEQAERAFAAAVQRYVHLQAERNQLLVTYKADAPKVQAKDAELTIAVQQMEAALAKVDFAHRRAFEEFGNCCDSSIGRSRT